MKRIEYIEKPDLKKARLRKENAQVINYEYIPSNELREYFNDKTFYIRTYGCQANVRDEETMAGLLTSIGMERVLNEKDAYLSILNTCAVRENAEDKVFGEIGEFKNIKLKDKNKILIISGCMIQQSHIIEHIVEKFPFVDLFLGTHNIHELLPLLEKFIKNRHIMVNVSSKVGDIIEELPCKRLDNAKAFVNITYGCNNFCTYCIVPYTRGKERSRDIQDILKECRELVDAGYQEITLLGQNVDAYGKDLNFKYTFANLLEEVAKLGIPRLRFLTSYPSDLKDDVIDVMTKYKNIMKYIHLPVQSGSDAVLKRMNRRYTSKEYLELVEKIRNKIPEMAFSTDIIVGFPNESYEEFLETIELAKKVHYTSAFTFIYSPRRGTPAADIEDNVTYQEKVKRFKELVKALEVDFKEKAGQMVGKTVDVLVDGFSKKNCKILTGFSENLKTIHFSGDESLIGKIVRVKILESKVYSLHGEIINE